MIGNILVLIVWLAVIATLVSSKSKTSSVVNSLSGAFTGALKAAKSE